MTQPDASLADRARSLAPLLAQHAAEAERLRRPHDAVIRALEEARIFELMVPRCHGGLELDLDTFLEVGLALGEGDASMAWVSTFYIEHNWMLCQFPESFQRKLFADRSFVLAPAMVAPSGVAQPVEGGFRLSGRWQWGTGVMHADWVIISARVEGDGDQPDFRFFALPRSEVEVEDTWKVAGMVATGSHDVVIRDAVVPDERTVSVVEMSNGRAPGSRIHSGPLYRTPMVPILALAASMPAVGQARGALRAFADRLRERTPMGSTTKLAERPAAQMRLARADLEVRQAELLLSEVVSEVQALRDGASVGDRARWAAALALAVHQSKAVLQSIAEASGARAQFSEHPFQRALRDIHMLSGHVIFDLDARLEMHGRALLGFEPGGLL